jgi:hypothetical protein
MNNTKEYITKDRPGLIIGITGLARSGKDTLADMLMEHLSSVSTPIVLPMDTDSGSRWTRYSFATPIKEMLEAGLGLVDKDVKTEQLYGSEVTYRKLAQTLGTEWGRDIIRSDLWTHIAGLRNIGKNLILSDVRMENEAQWIRDQGGAVIHLIRPQQEIIPESYHKTEAGIKCLRGDFRVYNTGGKGALWTSAKAVANELAMKFNVLEPAMAEPAIWGLGAQQELALSEESLPRVGSYWRHANGNVYKVEMVANKGSSKESYPCSIVYSNARTGEVWSKPLLNWLLRMEPLADGTQGPTQDPTLEE